MHASLKYFIHLACLPHHIALFKSFACIVLFSRRNERNCYIHTKNRKKGINIFISIFFRCEKEKFNFIEMNSTKKMYKMRSNEFQFTKNTFISFSQKSSKESIQK